MVIEWLRFRVPVSEHDRFLHHDRRIWTATLEQCDGFICKEVWQAPEQADELICVVHWASRKQWKAIAQDLLETTEARFQTATDSVSELLEVREFNVVCSA